MRKSSSFETTVLAIVSTTSAAALALYVYQFAGRPIGNPDAWATFGDYLGGTLNPVIGIATVVLVVRTLMITRQEAADTRSQLEAQTRQLELQVNHFKKQETLVDMHRRLEGALAAWNEAMRTPFPNVYYRRDNSLTRSDDETFRKLLYRFRLHLDLNTIVDEDEKDIVKREWDKRFNECVNILIELADYCSDYDQVVGDQVLTDYYRKRVNPAVRAFVQVGILTDQVANRLHAIHYAGTGFVSPMSGPIKSIFFPEVDG